MTMLRNPQAIPYGCVCDPNCEEWLKSPRRAVCDAPVFSTSNVKESPTDVCDRCEHDRQCHDFGDEEETDDSPVLITNNTILSGGELMAQTFSHFNQIFGEKK